MPGRQLVASHREHTACSQRLPSAQGFSLEPSLRQWESRMHSWEGGAERHCVPFLVRITARFLLNSVSNLISAAALLIWGSKSIFKSSGSGECSVVWNHKTTLAFLGEVLSWSYRRQPWLQTQQLTHREKHWPSLMTLAGGEREEPAPPAHVTIFPHYSPTIISIIIKMCMQVHWPTWRFHKYK